MTRDLKVPLQITTTATGAELSGETTIKRLDYGVGQGDLKDTDWVSDDVRLRYKVSLTTSAR